MKLWYVKPASDWLEALPIGNGRLGAMVHGGMERERLQINEETFWSGGPHDYRRPGASRYLRQVQELIFQDKVEEAQQLFDERMKGDPELLHAFLPCCDMMLHFPGHADGRDYYRELDLDRAVATTRYRVNGVTYTREVFCSYPDQAIIMRISSDCPGKIDMAAELAAANGEQRVRFAGDDTLVLTGQAGKREARPRRLNAGWDGPGVRFEARLRAISEGGRVLRGEQALEVRGADAVTLIFSAATSFVNYRSIDGDPGTKAAGVIERLQGKSYGELLGRHLEDYTALYRRVELELGDGAGDGTPTDERVRTYAETEDPGLAALFYQYGRYLLIASSRPGGQPANLQGIWNDDPWPLWGSKWTTNINVQMNYWPAESGNLRECHLPLFDLIDDLRITGAETAETHYGCRGFVVHHNTDLWRAATPVDYDAAVWPMGGVWLVQHLWDHYEYCPDQAFLRNRVYPALREAALFVLDYLTEAPEGTRLAGKLVTNPSYSPENHYIDDKGRRRYLTYAATMDIQLIRDLFQRCMKAAEMLGVDEDFRGELEEAMARLPGMQIGKYGQLQEWAEDWDRPDDHNSHVSHLYGLYPGNQISVKDTPELAEAVGRSLELRGTHDFRAWPAAWRIALHAHLRDARMAHRRLVNLIALSANPNLLNEKPPLPMQIDGNFGGTAAIAEMLLQSRSRYDGTAAVYEIELLPALPAQWSRGRVKGLRARGGFELAFAWENGRLTEASLHALCGGICRIYYGDRSVQLETSKGDTIPIQF
jgi:alpha-L-fucosidase 2